MKKYNLKEGEELYVVENSYGITLTPYDPSLKSRFPALRIRIINLIIH